MGSDEYVMVPREPTEEMLRAGLVGVEEPAAPLVGMRRLSNAYRAMLSAAPPSPRSDDGEPYTVQCTDNGFLGDVLPAAAPPSPTPSGEVGELARLLNAAADAFEREAEDGFEAGERADLWDQVVEVPLKDVRTAASLLLSLDAERRKLREALAPFAKHGELLVGSGQFADHDDDIVAAGFRDNPVTLGDFRRARSALPASDEKDSP